MKKYFSIVACAIMALLSSCTTVEVKPGQEAVLVDYPIIFGTGGCRDEVKTEGLYYTWLSTDPIYFWTIPVKYEEKFDDLATDDEIRLDFETTLTLQIKKGRSPQLYKNYGENWYKNNIVDTYTKYVRDEVSRQKCQDLFANREVLAEMDETIKNRLNAYIAELSKGAEFPVVCTKVVTGRGIPNAEHKKEMDRTAAAMQSAQTQKNKENAEKARKAAEEARAEADKAYMQKMNMSANDFLMLKIIEKSNPNIDVIIGGGAQSMFNVRR